MGKEVNYSELKFEEALEQLEAIVQHLEQGEVPLEEALEQFTKGMALSKVCQEKLDHAEETLTKIVEEDDREVPFEQE